MNNLIVKEGISKEKATECILNACRGNAERKSVNDGFNVVRFFDNFDETHSVYIVTLGIPLASANVDKFDV